MSLVVLEVCALPCPSLELVGVLFGAQPTMPVLGSQWNCLSCRRLILAPEVPKLDLWGFSAALSEPCVSISAGHLEVTQVQHVYPR